MFAVEQKNKVLCFNYLCAHRPLDCPQILRRRRIFLGKPIVRVSAEDAMDDEKIQAISKVIGEWIEMDRRNIVNKAAGMYLVIGPTAYKTNGGPPTTTKRTVRFFWNPNNLQNCLRNFGWAATALRVVIQAIENQNRAMPLSAEHVSSLNDVLVRFGPTLGSLAQRALRRHVGLPL